MTLYIDPGPSLLQSKREAKLTWPQALGELIDNSFDAGAMNVSITFGPGKQLNIRDDGAGCDNLQAMLTLGSHYRTVSTRLGRYGVGLKDAACWMWGELVIATVSGDVLYNLNVNWAELVKRNAWELPDPITVPRNGKVGSSLTFRNIEKGLPRDYERLCDELSYTFTPGLLKGYQIRFQFQKKHPILAKPYSLPAFSEILEDSFAIDGRGVKLRVGIVKEGVPNYRPGFAFCHHHRVIMTNALGAGDFSTARIAGQIFLDDAWRLSVHKDDISDMQDELSEQIFTRCKDILSAAQVQAKTIASQIFTARLNERLRAAMRDFAEKHNRKEKRKSPENKTGAVQPTNSGKKRRKAAKTQLGDKMLSDEQIGKLRLEWRPFEEQTLGEVDEKGARIWLNQTNAHLDDLRRSENDQAIIAIAMAMYVHKAVSSGEIQSYFPGMRETPEERSGFTSTLAKLLDSISSATKATP